MEDKSDPQKDSEEKSQNENNSINPKPPKKNLQSK